VTSILLVTASPAAAQVNIERHRPTDEGTSSTLDASVSIRSGNSDLYDVSGSGQVNHWSGASMVLAVARVRYGKNDGNTYSSSSFGHIRLTHWFTTDVAAEVFGQLERDRFTLLQVRTLLGAGSRLRMAGSDRFSMYYGSSLMLELENLDESKVLLHPTSTETFRWSNYVSLRWEITEHTSFSSTAYAQPRLTDFEDLRLLHDAALEVGITSVVSLRVVLRQRLDGRPPDGIDRYDIFLENGLRVRL
jgi:hypothetical protein